MRFMIGFAVAATLAATCARAEGPGEVTDLAPFKAIELHYDGVVEVRHGLAQKVTLAAGDRWKDTFTVTDGKLAIHGCKGCGAGFRVVIITPAVEALGIVEGGALNIAGDFPRQPRLALRVERGGTLEALSLPADRVTAQVVEAGRIDTSPVDELIVSTTGTGAVVHTGNPRIAHLNER